MIGICFLWSYCLQCQNCCCNDNQSHVSQSSIPPTPTPFTPSNLSPQSASPSSSNQTLHPLSTTGDERQSSDSNYSRSSLVDPYQTINANNPCILFIIIVIFIYFSIFTWIQSTYSYCGINTLCNTSSYHRPFDHLQCMSKKYMKIRMIFLHSSYFWHNKFDRCYNVLYFMEYIRKSWQQSWTMLKYSVPYH